MTCQQTVPDKMRVARSFGNAATSYDRYARLQRDIADMLLGRLDDGRADSILDLGSGTGYCANRLGERYPDAVIHSLDIAEAMLVLARGAGRSPTGQFVCGDAEALPYAADRFDLVLSNLTLQWCQDPARVFRELHRVMRPGASAWISTLAEHTLGELKTSWRQVDDYVHVNDFLPVADLTAMLDGVPFAQTRVRRSREIYFYDSLAALTRELKGIGAHNLNGGQSPGLTGRNKLLRLKAAFEDGREPGRGIPVTYDVVILKLVK